MYMCICIYHYIYIYISLYIYIYIIFCAMWLLTLWLLLVISTSSTSRLLHRHAMTADSGRQPGRSPRLTCWHRRPQGIVVGKSSKKRVQNDVYIYIYIYCIIHIRYFIYILYILYIYICIYIYIIDLYSAIWCCGCGFVVESPSSWCFFRWNHGFFVSGIHHFLDEALAKLSPLIFSGWALTTSAPKGAWRC